MRRLVQVSVGILVAVLITTQARAQQALAWCEAPAPRGLGRYTSCGQGRSATEAEREALAGIARQLRASVTDTVKGTRGVITEGLVGERQTATLADTSTVQIQVVSDAVLRNARIERRGQIKRTHYARALLDLSRELSALEDLTGHAEDSLAAGRIGSALTLCRHALILIDSLPWSAVEDIEGRFCGMIQDRIDRSLSVKLRDLDHAIVHVGRAPVAGVRLVIRRSSGSRIRLSTPTDRHGVATLPPVAGYVGGGPVSEEIDLDWIDVGPTVATIPFRPRAVRTFITRGVSVTISVSGALSATDRLTLAAAIGHGLRDLGFTVVEGAAACEWTLAIHGEMRDAPASLGDVATAAATIRWELSGDGVRLGQGGAVEVRGVGTDRAAARAQALGHAAEALTADVESVVARRVP